MSIPGLIEAAKQQNTLNQGKSWGLYKFLGFSAVWHFRALTGYYECLRLSVCFISALQASLKLQVSWGIPNEPEI